MVSLLAVVIQGPIVRRLVLDLLGFAALLVELIPPLPTPVFSRIAVVVAGWRSRGRTATMTRGHPRCLLRGMVTTACFPGLVMSPSVCFCLLLALLQVRDLFLQLGLLSAAVVAETGYWKHAA
jgi:hypothetical protein